MRWIGRFIGFVVIVTIIGVLAGLLMPLLLLGSIIGYWHFTKKNPNEKMATYSKYGMVVGFLGVLLLFGSSESSNPDTSDVADSKEEEVVEVSKKFEDNGKKEMGEKRNSQFKSIQKEEKGEKFDEEIQSINEKINEHVEMDKGWALGLLDENGKPVENGTPDPDRSYALYVHEVKYDGSSIRIQTDEGFFSLDNSKKSIIARRVQDIANSIIGPIENWDANKYQERIFIEVYNGDSSLGHSKALNKTEYKWY